MKRHENKVDANEFSLAKVEFKRQDGMGYFDMDLNSSVVAYAGCTSPATLCRMCAARMQLGTLERLILGMLLDDYECRGMRQYSYAELGRAVGRGVHSAERAVAVLRSEGLVLTTRVGKVGAYIAFSCDAFIRWAEDTLDAHLVVPVAAPTVIQQAAETAPEAVQEAAAPKKAKRTPKPKKAPVEAPEAVSDDSEKKPHELTDIEKEYGEGMTQEKVDAIIKEQLMGLDPNNLPPGVWIDDNWMPHFDFDSGYPVPPQFQLKIVLEPPVDASEERAGTLAAAGRTGDEEDSDELTFGSETAETDLGNGFAMNPDL